GILSFYSLALLTLESESTEQNWFRRRWPLLAVFGVATWITAMMKALYLWPATLLLAFLLVTRRLKFGLRLAVIIGCFAFAGISFLAWNTYAASVNDAAPFMRGVQPTSLLGMSALVDPKFYYSMLVQRPKWWLGVLGVLLFPVGLVAAWMQRRDENRAMR